MKKTALAIALVSATLLVSACKEEVKKPVDLTTEKAKLSYAIGYQFGKSVIDTKITDSVDAVIAAQALEETIAGNAAMSEEEVIAALQAFQKRKQEEVSAEFEKKAAAGIAFLEENKSKEGVVVTESGLQYKVVTEGAGASPAEDAQVEVNYKGSLVDGTVFDSSYDRGQPAVFPLANVIAGFREGISLMKEGGKSILYIPSDIAYGAQAPGIIGPNQTLIFEVELLKIK